MRLTDIEKHIQSFNDAALLYDEVRPGYPIEVIDRIISEAGLKDNAKILEIGCGTGQITIPLAKKGYNIVALDKGLDLVKLAMTNLSKFKNVSIIHSSFENWQEGLEKFDLIISAQAFHWIDAEYGVSRASELLDSSGALALVWKHQEGSKNTDFWKVTNPLYEKYSLSTTSGSWTMKQSADNCLKILKLSPFFSNSLEITKSWKKTYSHDDYLKLLNTYSDHRTMKKEQKTAFFSEISSIIDRMRGSVERFYETVAYVAKKDA